MPVKIEPYRQVDLDIRERISSSYTKEAAVLEAVRRAGLASVDAVAEAVAFDRESASRALYRLKRKELVVKADGGYELASEEVETLAKALIVPDEHLAE